MQAEFQTNRRFSIAGGLMVLASAALLAGIIILVVTRLAAGQGGQPGNSEHAASSVLPEIEATEFNGVKLVPIRDQGNNAIEGTRHIDIGTWRLSVTGLVENELSMSYDDLLKLPMISEAVYMPCVEGWGFMAKWTGFAVSDLLNLAVLKPEASYVMFWTDEGYATGLPLSYIRDNGIILAYGLNDMTLPDDRGFPLQLVAKSKYGYKWAKWITRIEILDHEELGYWEQRGYSNVGDEGGPRFSGGM
jgi:DMSO/TMAO reductase YedYZ molybdopterin-dependent catalytic subunit